MPGSGDTVGEERNQPAVNDDEEAWLSVLELCGEEVRDGHSSNNRGGASLASQVEARSYSLRQAARLLSLNPATLRKAASELSLDSFLDPKGTLRFPVYSFRPMADDADLREMIAGYERLSQQELRSLLAVDGTTLRGMLRQAGIMGKGIIWRDVRGLWGLPETFVEYRGLIRPEEDEQPSGRRRKRRGKRSRRRKRDARSSLRKRLIDAFPQWRYPFRESQKIYLHIGEPNSGKTHDALQALKQAESGWYLAPLRLLAYEIFDRLNDEGVACSLLTGEEYIPVAGAKITAATIEMFNPLNSGACVIVDEAQMLADADRGWAWTRAMMESASAEMHIIGPPTAQRLIEVLAAAAEIPCEVLRHERLAPIKVAERHHTLESLPPHTILIAFTRQGVLDLKMKLERLGRAVSVVYGSLPPEVRRRQAERFATGETDICVATDAVGMGLNLPADVVCFYDTEKYDGKNDRLLLPNEVHQIGGRAGRFGMSKSGLISAISRNQLRIIRELYDKEAPQLSFARVAPTVDDLRMIPGHLAEQLEQWAALESIPEELRAVITTADLAERVELAKMLTDDEIKRLGLADALQLVNAPARKTTRNYWLDCAYMILEGYQIPMPPAAPEPIVNSRDLEATEQSIACADIYLWLSRRKEFGAYCESHAQVREERREWSLSIDEALLRDLDMARRCRKCGDVLPSRHRYRICERCFRGGRR